MAFNLLGIDRGVLTDCFSHSEIPKANYPTGKSDYEVNLSPFSTHMNTSPHSWHCQVNQMLITLPLQAYNIFREKQFAYDKLMASHKSMIIKLSLSIMGCIKWCGLTDNMLFVATK